MIGHLVLGREFPINSNQHTLTKIS